MARTRKSKSQRRHAEDRQFTARVMRRSPVDGEKLTAAFAGLAEARAEQEAQAEHERSHEGFAE